MVTLAAHLSEIGNLPVRETLRVCLRSVQESSDTRSGQEAVVFGFECGELFTANVRASARHHHGGIPT